MKKNPVITLHGVFMNIFGVGTFLVGKSGIGKSALALALIDRGHQFVADDVVEFFRSENIEIKGRCPDLLQNFLAVRSLGILNIAKLFGPQAILKEQKLSVIVNLVTDNRLPSKITEDLTSDVIVLDMKFPQINLSVTHHRLELMIEMIVRNHILKQAGYDANCDFVQQQKTQLEDESV